MNALCQGSGLIDISISLVRSGKAVGGIHENVQEDSSLEAQATANQGATEPVDQCPQGVLSSIKDNGHRSWS